MDSCTGALKGGQQIYYNPNKSHNEQFNPQEHSSCLAEIVNNLGGGEYNIKCIDEIDNKRDSDVLVKEKVFKAKDTLFECLS